MDAYGQAGLARGDFPSGLLARHPAEWQDIASFPLRWWKTLAAHECAVPDAHELCGINDTSNFNPVKFKRNDVITLERT